MRRALVAGNWKMYGTPQSVRELVADLLTGLACVAGTEVAICPSFVFLDAVKQQISGHSIVLGAQNVCDRDEGAFTGEVSADMLQAMDCAYALVGHSERRALYGESSELVAMRFEQAQVGGIVPILCLGETLDEREAGHTEQVVKAQLDAVVVRVGIQKMRDCVVAYEPVWAIGTGMTATPEQANEVHAFIRQELASLDAETAEGVRILYGGSVKATNADALFGQHDIDGGLIGGASLKADEFLSICHSAARAMPGA